MSAEMDGATFQAALETQIPEPDLDHLIKRFNLAFRGTEGNTDAAMAAVNEVLANPISYDVLMGRIKKAA